MSPNIPQFLVFWINSTDDIAPQYSLRSPSTISFHLSLSNLQLFPVIKMCLNALFLYNQRRMLVSFLQLHTVAYSCSTFINLLYKIIVSYSRCSRCLHHFTQTPRLCGLQVLPKFGHPYSNAVIDQYRFNITLQYFLSYI